MASPFAVFRRNQKIMLAVVGIAAMVAFVFLDPLTRYIGRSGQPENPVVVETNFGAVRQSELDSIRSSRELVATFIGRLALATVRSAVGQGQIDSRYADVYAQQLSSQLTEQLLQRSQVGPEKEALETLLLSRKAQQMGMVVSDTAINDLLKQITNGAVSTDEMRQLVAGLRGGRQVSATRLFDAIRIEMLASRFSQLFAQSVRDIPPAQRFEYYLRLNRQAKAEVMPVAVADFTTQVGEPAAAEVTALYEKYKNDYPDPTSPDPGFKQPKRAAFQYFKANLAKFQEEYKPQVTEAEIREYYEKNKAQFRAFDLSADSEKSDSEKSDSEKSDSEKSDSEKPADAAATESKPADESQPEATSEPPASDAGEAPKNNNADKAASDDAQPQAATSRPAVRLAGSPPAPARLRLVSASEPAAEEAAKDNGAEPAAPADAAEQPEAKTPDGEKQDEQQPAADAATADEPEAPKAEEPKYEPLEKVQEKIRDSIAGQKASERIKTVFDELSADMRRYADELDLYNAQKSSHANASPPRPLPFAELAKAKGVEASELPLVSGRDASKEDIGRVFRQVIDRRGMGMRTESFAEFAFSEVLVTYRPVIGEDADGNAFLFWKTQEEAAYVPTLDQARDQVIQAWKMIQARVLARKRADEYALQARNAKKSLKDVFSAQTNLKVTETAPFSWLTVGDVPLGMDSSSRPRLSTVAGVEDAGQQFMEDVFQLAPGSVGVAINQPKNILYVVRLIEFTRTDDELRQDFAVENPQRYMSVAVPDQRGIYTAWIDDLQSQAKVRWLRPADSLGRRQAPQSDPTDDSGGDE